ncbi:uncharacterized protein LOC142225975 isoform X2 [Haematobia irritans]|uniref:uncharacterized protein LOC142220512 n=1 Tax=Haematobia irritans TaxID=7368 RepID=UPI003F5036B3
MDNAKRQKLSKSKSSACNNTNDELFLAIRAEINHIKDLIKQKEQIDETRYNMVLQTLANQNLTISNLLAEQKVALQSLSKSVNGVSLQFLSMFPIETEAELNKFERTINEDNRDHIVTSIRSLLIGKGIVKGLTSIIKQNLLLEYNFQGIHNKKPLRNFKNLMKVLEMASFNTVQDNKDTFEDSIRKAIKNAKNRHFKNKCISEKSKSSSNEDPIV